MRVSRLIRSSAIVSTGLAVLLLSACSGDDTKSTAAGPSAAGSTASGSTAPSASGSSGPATTAGPTTKPTPGKPATATPGPSVGVSTLPPAPVGSSVALQTGVEVSIAGVKDTKVGATGPGEIAGPAAVVTVRVHNGTSTPFALSAIAVVASYGKGTPASPSDSGGAKPLIGSLAPGKTADGTYVFLTPAAQASSLRVEVSSGTSAKVVVFQR